MRILVFSTLFPNAAAPSHGVFVENRLSAFRKNYDVDVKVIAPVAWFPLRHKAFGAYAAAARAPLREMRDGVEVLHPRYFIPPKVAMRFAPGALTRCLRRAAQGLIDSGWDFDLIDAHYFYPDGVAAARAARSLGKPFVVTARGTDISLIPAFEKPRKYILDAAWRADAVITVADALKQELARLGAPSEKISVLRNGVDLNIFTPIDREAARQTLKVDGLVIASVGHLIERKGHNLAISALKDIEDATLLIAGEGPLRAALEAQAIASGVGGRVRFLGRVAHDELRRVYGAADILVLASSREGWPNVLLEAMACGTPCVATDVWGSGEVIRSSDAGRLVQERSATALAAAVTDLAASPPVRAATRAYAEQHSWDATSAGMAEIFATIADKAQTARSTRCAQINISTDKYRPRLIVTVDTEEQFDWRRFDTHDHAVNTPEGLKKFQALCANAGAKPLYFLTTPMLGDDAMTAHFRDLIDSGAADCGLHLHQWTTEPRTHDGEYYSFQKNLPRKIHREKLEALSGAFERALGFRARSHRAGRYGVSPSCYELLASVGVEMDFSPSAGFDFSARGGPDFSRLSNAPFVMSGDDWRIAVTPVCGAKAVRRTRLFLPTETTTAGFSTGAASQSARLIRPMRLSPEGASLADMQALTRRLVADETPVLTFSLHSTSLTPGASPYSPDNESVDRLLRVTAEYVDWFSGELCGAHTTLSQLATLYADA